MAADDFQTTTRGSDSAFSLLMSRVKAGDKDAERELIDSYGGHVLRVVRRRLDSRLRTYCDSQDFYQAVWASFFAQRAEMERFASIHDLLAFLGGMAGHKIIDEARRLTSQKRNINREFSLEEIDAPLRASSAGRTATPSEFAVANEWKARLAAGRPELHQRIIQRREEGATNKEIAAEVGMDEGTVRRILKRIRRELFEQPPPAPPIVSREAARADDSHCEPLER